MSNEQKHQMQHVLMAQQQQGLKKVNSDTVQNKQVVQTALQNVVDPSASVMTERGEQMSAKKALQQLGPLAPVAVQNAHVQPGADVKVTQSTPTVQDKVNQQLLDTSQVHTKNLQAVSHQQVPSHQPVIVAASQVEDPEATVVPIGAHEATQLHQAINAGMPLDHPVVTQNAHVIPGTQVLTTQGGQQGIQGQGKQGKQGKQGIQGIQGKQGKQQGVVTKMQQALKPAHMAQMGQKVLAAAVPDAAVVVAKIADVDDLNAKVMLPGQTKPVTLKQALEDGVTLNTHVAVQAKHVQDAAKVQLPAAPQQAHMAQMGQKGQKGQKVLAAAVPDAAMVVAKIADVDDLNAKVMLPGQTKPVTLKQALEDGVTLNTHVAVQAKHVQDAAKVQLPAAQLPAQSVQTQSGKNGTDDQLKHVADLPAQQLTTVKTNHVAPEQVVQAKLGHIQPGASVRVQGVQGTMTTQQAKKAGIPADELVAVVNADVKNPHAIVNVPQSAPRIKQGALSDQLPPAKAEQLRQVATNTPQALDTAVSHQLNPHTQVVAHLDAVNPQAPVLTLDGKQITAQKALQTRQHHAITSAENVLPQTHVQVLKQTIPVLAQAVPAKQQVLAPVHRVQQKAQVKTQDGQVMSAFQANILNPLQSVFAPAGKVQQNTIVQVPVNMAGNPMKSANQQRQQAVNRMTGTNFASRFMADARNVV